MQIGQGTKALDLLEECLAEMESPKGQVSSGVQKLYRAAVFLEEDDIAIWCQIQLGHSDYAKPFEALNKYALSAYMSLIIGVLHHQVQPGNGRIVDVSIHLH